MRALFRGIALVVLALPPGAPSRSLRRIQTTFECQGPAQGCSNGLWNQDECSCKCIKPFCPHPSTGDCTFQGARGCDNENPWADCTPGLNCPWFLDNTVQESCTAGSQIPAGLYDIFENRNACCFVNFPYSRTCTEQTNSPTTRPTAPGTTSKFQVIPLKLSLTDIPAEFDARALKDELLLILKRVVVELADRMDNLRITKVEEDFARNTGVVSEDQRDASLDIFFKITVVRIEGVDFPTILITWIRDSYDDVVGMIREYTSQTYFGTEVGLNWCTQPDDLTPTSLFSKCNSETTQFITKMKQVAEIPLKQMAEDLAVIHRRNIERDIADLEVEEVVVKEILGLPGGYVDVVFEVKSKQVYGKNFEETILKTVHENEADVLEEIQSYSIMELGKDLYWCLDTKERVYTTCKKPTVVKEEPASSGFPLMTIIGVAVGVILLVFAGILCICLRNNKKRGVEKSELNMMSYMQSGSAGRAQPMSQASTYNMSRRDSLKQCKSGFDPMLDLMSANPTLSAREYDRRSTSRTMETGEYDDETFLRGRDGSMRQDYRGGQGGMREMSDRRRSHVHDRKRRPKKKRPRNEVRPAPADAAVPSGDDAAHIQDLVLAIEAGPVQTELNPPRDVNGDSRKRGESVRNQNSRRYEPEPRYKPEPRRKEDPPENALVLYGSE